MTSWKCFRVKDGVDLDEFAKFGFRKHRCDENDVCISKWSRRWVEADTIDGYPCGSSGWEFYSHIDIYKDRTLSIYIDGGYGRNIDDQLMVFYDIVKAGLIEVVKKKVNDEM